jgi:DNA-binding transcriptional LysR family regulator
MHNRRLFNWDDLKPFLAVARAGSTLAGAKLLGVSQPTIQRRITALEKALGCQLFERHPSGYRLSTSGAELCACAEQVEKAVHDFNRQVQLRDGKLSGTIRVTCPELLASRVVTPMIGAFQRQHPDVKIELLTTDRSLDLTSGEADIAIRPYEIAPHGERESALIQRKVGEAPWAVYASRVYVERHGKPSTPEEISWHTIITADGTAFHTRTTRWLQNQAPAAVISVRSGSLLGLLASTKAGAGLALLPVGLGDPDPELVRILDPSPPVVVSLYLLMHPDLRSTPRFRTFFDFCVSEFRLYRPALGGEASGQRSSR